MMTTEEINYQTKHYRKKIVAYFFENNDIYCEWFDEEPTTVRLFLNEIPFEFTYDFSGISVLRDHWNNVSKEFILNEYYDKLMKILFITKVSNLDKVVDAIKFIRLVQKNYQKLIQKLTYLKSKNFTNTNHETRFKFSTIERKA